MHWGELQVGVWWTQKQAIDPGPESALAREGEGPVPGVSDCHLPGALMGTSAGDAGSQQ